MLQLSLSAHAPRNLALCNVIASVDAFTAVGFTYPGEPTDPGGLGAYKATLFRQLQNPCCQAYKDALRITRLHARGFTVLLRLHADAVHGDVLLAALRWFAATQEHATPGARPTPKREPACTYVPAQTAYAPDSGWREEDELDARRLVWVTGCQGDVAHLSYIWDTDGVVTALTPGYGLIKLGRIHRQGERRAGGAHTVSFWQARATGDAITPKCHVAHVALGGHMEAVFARLVHIQRQTETTVTDLDERYDPWALASDPTHEDLEEAERRNAEAQWEAETQAFLALYDTGPQQFDWRKLLPCAYHGEHVRYVLKTKADGSRWVLTRSQQAKGCLHLYQRVK